MAEEKAQTTPSGASFAQLQQRKPATPGGDMQFIQDVPLKLNVQLGSTKILVQDALQLGEGSVVELEKSAGEPLDVLIGDKLVARGEVVVVNEKFGVRLTDILK